MILAPAARHRCGWPSREVAPRGARARTLTDAAGSRRTDGVRVNARHPSSANSSVATYCARPRSISARCGH